VLSPDLLREVEPVDRVDGIEEPHGVLRLVALQVADQVPGAATDFLDFPACLLHFIFAEMRDAGPQGFLDGGGGSRFGDGDQLDFRRVAARFLSRQSNGFVNPLEAGRKIIHQVSLSLKRASVIPLRRVLTYH